MNISLPSEWALFVGFFYFLAIAIVHIGFTAVVVADTQKLKLAAHGPLMAAPWLWGLATLLGGVFVAVLYWLVNHSTLSRGAAP
jgi:hypothetical protein